jgi:hypothetical protein
MAGAVEGDRNRLEPRPAPLQKGYGRANFARTVKQTGFSAPGDKPEKFAESGAGLALPGSHPAHKRRVRRGFSAHSRLWGSATDWMAESGGFELLVPGNGKARYCITVPNRRLALEPSELLKDR